MKAHITNPENYGWEMKDDEYLPTKKAGGLKNVDISKQIYSFNALG